MTETLEQPEAPLRDAPTPWDTVAPDDVSLHRQRALDPIVAIARAAAPGMPSGGALTIPLICAGIGVIAMCLLIPAADEVRRLAYERDRLKADLAQLHVQVETNQAFLDRVSSDPVLAERLARRQMKMVPEGTALLDLKGMRPTSHDMSPFLLVTVPPPAPMPPYKPMGGVLSRACRHPKTQLYLIGASLLSIASGLVLSRSTPARDADKPLA